jgi:ubiquinone/menaquinone biosynthesis C-methylase UbiE
MGSARGVCFHRYSMTNYIHGYADTERARLVAQAEHWRSGLINDGTTRLDPGTKLLEIGCGPGAVLAVLGEEFPGVRLHGVDIDPTQLDSGRAYLAAAGLDAELTEADAHALPFPDGAFDHIWMMWVLEHLEHPLGALREARRVLRGDGQITAIEVDYSTCASRPSTPEIEMLFDAMVRGMASTGHSDAGTQLPGWLAAAGFRDVDPGERPFWWMGSELEGQANYAADVMEGVVPRLAELPGSASEADLRQGVADLRALAAEPGAGLGWIVHKSTARP